MQVAKGVAQRKLVPPAAAEAIVVVAPDSELEGVFGFVDDRSDRVLLVLEGPVVEAAEQI